MQDYKVVEGYDTNIDCPIISGNDSWRSVKWLNKHNAPVGQNGSLNMKNVTRLANGTYTCRLDFIMEPTYGSQKNDTVTKGFYLDVLYKAEILSLSFNDEVNSLTVNKSARVHFACYVDSNPSSTVELEFRNKSLSTKSNTHTLDYLIPSVNCNDTGTYVCSGNNAYNNGLRAWKNNTLFVTCSPRRSPSFGLKENVTSALNNTATFYFITMAYPLPSLQWYKVPNGSEVSEEHGGVVNTYNVSTNEMQINLTLDLVKETQYGEYLLNIKNPYGTFNQKFYLVAEGKPNPPTLYGYYPVSVSSDSVTIWWEPGFDGGLPQSFIISYNHTSSEWYNETAIKHDKEYRMNTTITGLASGSKYHILIYAENEKGAAVTDEIIVHTKELSNDAVTKPSIVGAAVGGVVGALLAIFTVVVVVVLVRKRSLGKLDRAKGQKCDFKESHTYTNFSKEMKINTSSTDEKASFIRTKDTSLDSPKLPERMPLKLAPKHNLQELDDYDDKAEEKIYGNTKDVIKRIERITVSELNPYLTSKTTDYFGLEFQGYKNKKAFIASLGPLARTSYNFVTFWQMVWSEKSDVIVMLTKLKEPSGVKCDQYWPDTDNALSYGDITVASLGEDLYADYVLRKFTLTKGNKSRKLMQFHFMAWPDKSVPEDVTCLLEFRKRVNANHSSGPIIVHCSAGIGRTGTLIAIEILIEEGQREGSVNVVECVKTMRDQRTSMVQTVDQYYFIYKALVNALVFGCETISVQKFPKYLDEKNADQLNKMFQAFNQSVESDSTTESNARTANKMQRDKNRMGSDIPGDSHRVRLFLNRYEETSTDYINAVHIDSFTKNEQFIVAQSPMADGVEDFLCMICQVECTCIVSLGDNHHRTNVGMFIPTDDTQSLSMGCFKVTCKVLDTKDNYIIRKLKIEFKGKYDGGEKDVYHFEYNDWALGQKTPRDPHKFVEFTLEVEEFASQLGTGKSQVLVHCLNAFERSCLFCAVVTLVEKVKYEGEVCVPNILRHIRARRKLAFPNMEQFQFCFKAVRAYITIDKTGPSVEEKAYINMALV